MGNKRDTLEKYNGNVKWSELSDKEQGYFGSKDVFKNVKKNITVMMHRIQA